MSDTWHLLASFLAHGDYKGIATICQAMKDGHMQWFCRLSRKTPDGQLRVAIRYGEEITATVQAALDEVLA